MGAKTTLFVSIVTCKLQLDLNIVHRSYGPHTTEMVKLLNKAHDSLCITKLS